MNSSYIAHSAHSTTILALRHRSSMVFVGDGQVTVANTIMKHGAVKLRSIKSYGVLAGFAGSAADSFTLFERFEAKLNAHGGQLARSAVELAKEWRSDKYLRRLEAMMIVGDKGGMFLLSGVGDVIQPDDGVLAIGSGGNYALSAARALLCASVDKTAREIATISMQVAAQICPFTNDRFSFEEIEL